jgi:hypothetical protein
MEKLSKPIHTGKERVWVMLQMPQALHRAVRLAAAEDQLTMRSMVNVALQDYVVRRGLLQEDMAGDRQV